MNHQKTFVSSVGLLAFILATALPALSQADPKSIEPSYEAVLQVVIGSDQAGGELPRGLSAISQQLRSNYAFPSYRLANTIIGRLSAGGSFEYKSASDIFGQPENSEIPTFLEWNLGRLRVAQDERNQTVFQAEPFRFGARVPVRITRVKTGESSANETVNYEAVGLTTNRLSLAAGKPTLVGTLSLPKTAGTMFLVLTLRPVDN